MESAFMDILTLIVQFFFVMILILAAFLTSKYSGLQQPTGMIVGFVLGIPVCAVFTAVLKRFGFYKWWRAYFKSE
jgi:uncharacterized membrane protein required for colicin V production